MIIANKDRYVSIEPFTFASEDRVRITASAVSGFGLQYVFLANKEMLGICQYWMERQRAFQAAKQPISDQ